MNPFDRALRDLKRVGWCKNVLQNSEGNRCIVGALHYSMGISEGVYCYDTLTNVIKTEYPYFFDYNSNIVDFNNHPNTTFADIERILEKASAQYEEKGGFDASRSIS